MYMGVILTPENCAETLGGAPHVYGGDPQAGNYQVVNFKCSPCIWG